MSGMGNYIIYIEQMDGEGKRYFPVSAYPPAWTLHVVTQISAL